MDFLDGLLTDLVLFSGIVLFFLGFFKRHRQNRIKYIIAGIILVALGLGFTDWQSVYEAGQNGREWAEKVLNS